MEASSGGGTGYGSRAMLSIVQFSCSVLSHSLQSHGLQHTRLPCLSSTPRAWSNSCLSSQWCHSTISSSVVPFSSYPQSFPASGSFQMSQFFASGGQSIGVPTSTSVLSMNIQDWFPLRLIGLINLQPKGLTNFLQHHSSETSILQCSVFFMVQHSHPYMITGKNITLTRWIFVSKVTSLLFNMLSGFVIAFLPKSKCILISWLQSPPAVILEPKKIKCLTVSIVSNLFVMKWWERMPWY